MADFPEGGGDGAAKLPAGFVPIANSGYSANGLPRRIRCEQDGAVMVLVPEGIGVLGKNGLAKSAAPEHGAVLDSFYIDRDEVTHQRYEKFREATHETKRRVAAPVRTPDDQREPVAQLHWITGIRQVLPECAFRRQRGLRGR